MSFALAHQSKTSKKVDSKISPPEYSHASTLHSSNSNRPTAVGLAPDSLINRFDFAKITIQPKLKVSQQGDNYEQEADKIADQVMRMSVPSVPLNSAVPIETSKEPEIASKCSDCEKKEKVKNEEKMNISRKPSTTSNFETSEEITNEINTVLSRGGGSSLDSSTKEFMESRFGGYDFEHVKVHTNSQAARSAASVNALAYTIGNDIVFGEGQYRPNAIDGKRLLSHELTHVVQQAGAQPIRQAELKIDDPSNVREYEADSSASRIMSNLNIGAQLSGSLRGSSSVRRLQRTSFFESAVRFFGGGTFSEQELQDYLQFLDSENRIEDNYDSDNKAREIVRRWKRGDSLYILPVRRKILLIKEMLSGFTGDDDEQAILALLRGSADAQFAEILTGVGIEEMRSNIHGAERKQLEAIVEARPGAHLAAGEQLQGATAPEDSDRVFPEETVLRAQQLFSSNAVMEHHVRLNCIDIVRRMAPQLFAQDPELAERIRISLGKLRGQTLTMPDAGHVLVELGAATGPMSIPFNNGNGDQEPTAMTRSAWDAIMDMVGDVHGWHVFGLAVFDGYHSVTVFVDNRPDGKHVYWADQWAIGPGEDFGQEPGSVSGFRRYEKTGLDGFIEKYTRKWWNDVHSPNSKCGKTHPHTWDHSCRYTATLKIWHLKSGK